MISKEELYNKHPTLLTGKGEGVPFYLFGLEINDGWNDLLDRLLTDIEKQLEKEGIPLEEFYIFQIKEKFGGLRFYIGSGSDEIYDLIDRAEEESYTICEICGEEGKLYNTGWMSTRCERHKPKGFLEDDDV